MLVIVLVLLIGLVGIYLYRRAYRHNLDLHGSSSAILLIPTGAGFDAVKDSLLAHGYLRNPGSFEWTAKRKGYDRQVRPGRYRLKEGMTNSALVDLLRSGAQEPVRLFFRHARTPAELAGKVSGYIEADSLAILNLMRDQDFLRAFGVTPVTVFTILIPNTYEFFWNTSAQGFMTRMYKESEKFWEGARSEAAGEIGLSRTQVVTLASIVEKETYMNAEKAAIAGVYMNRLRLGMMLQADPTLIYAWNDYTIKRVLDRHKTINSPFNTYVHPGIPPGPICLPSVASIDAVLHYEKHDYLYFCAKEDFSGYHNFASTLAAHNRNAARYQQALSRSNILR